MTEVLQRIEKALDDEWDRRRKLANFANTKEESDRHALLGDIALMLRDAIGAGLGGRG
jgi:hypothetical protein